MLIFWRIRYLDRTDRQIKNRDLFLRTSTLDAVTRAAVELFMETKTNRTERDVFKFRHLFCEGERESIDALMKAGDKMEGITLTSYLEDENGIELTGRELGQILTGNPDCELLPAPLEQHDLEYRRAPQVPVPLKDVTLSKEQMKILGYFCRDLQELVKSSFFKEQRPATLRSGGNLPMGKSVVETAATDEEIRSAVTIFRRLYMANEPANFVKAAKVFSAALNNHPLAKWVEGESHSYEAKLDIGPTFAPPGLTDQCTFSKRLLIDVFLYTQYAHQPDDFHKKPNQQRERQFANCLNEVGGQHSVLTWLFLGELWFTAHAIHCAGRVIAGWFDQYCRHHQLTPDILRSLLHEHPGLGIIEKEADKSDRLFREKVEQLAAALCEQSGSPPGDSGRFLHQAHDQLKKALRGPYSSQHV
jgi:hypothetical protein